MNYIAVLLAYFAGVVTVFGGFDVSLSGLSWPWVAGLMMMLGAGVLVRNPA